MFPVYVTKPNRNCTYAYTVAPQTPWKQQMALLFAGPIPASTFELKKQTLCPVLLLMVLST